MASREVKVAILGDVDSFNRAMKSGSDEADAFAKKLDEHGKNLQKFGAALTIGVTVPIVAAFRAGIQEMEQSQAVAAQTTAVIASTGSAAHVTAGQVDALATSLLHKSGVDDEVIKSGENLLLTFTNIRNETGKGNDIFTQATKLALDLSVAWGEDMHSAAIQLGKALQDPITGVTSLRRVGVQLSDQQQQTIKDFVAVGDIMSAQKVILQELQKEVGGSAEAYGKTLAGSIARAKEEFNNAAAAVIGGIAPALETLAHIVETVSKFFENLPGPVKAVVGVLAVLAAGVGPVLVLIGSLLRAFDTIAEHSTTAAVGLQKVGGAVQGALPLLASFGAIFAAGAIISSYTGKLYDLATAVTNLGRTSGDAQVKLFALSTAQVALDHNTSLAAASMQVFEATARSNVGTAQTLIDNLKAAGVNTDAFEKALRKEQAAQEQANHNSQIASQLLGEQAGATDDATTAANTFYDATLALANAQLGLEGATLNVEAAMNTYFESVSKTTDASLESRQAHVQLEGAINAVQAQALQGYEAQVKLAGGTETAYGKAQAQIVALQSLAQQFPPLQGLIDTHIYLLSQIPPEKNTHATFNADWSAAEAWRDFLVNQIPRSVNTAVSAVGDNPFFRQHGGPIPGGPSQAVPVIAHGGEYVLSADVVSKIKAGRPSRGANVGGGSPWEGDGGSDGGTPIVIEITTTLDGAVIAKNTTSHMSRPGGPQIPPRAIAN